MDSTFQPSEFDLLLNDLCDNDWDNTSKETSLESSSHSSSPLTLPSRKTVRLDSKGNRKVKVTDGDVAYDFEVHFPRQRVVSTDIRRSFGTMFVNVMNAGDFPLMFGFLNTFFSPNITRVSRKTYVSENQPYKSSVQDGVLEIARHWYNSNRFAPDTVVSLHNTRLHTYSDGAESKLVTGIKLSCTRIFDDKFSCLQKQEPSMIKSTLVSRDCSSSGSSSSSSGDDTSVESRSSSNSSAFSMSTVYESNSGNKKRRNAGSEDTADWQSVLNKSVDSMEKGMTGLTLREKPVRLVGVGELSMFFNANKAITKMVMNVRVDVDENQLD